MHFECQGNNLNSKLQINWLWFWDFSFSCQATWTTEHKWFSNKSLPCFVNGAETKLKTCWCHLQFTFCPLAFFAVTLCYHVVDRSVFLFVTVKRRRLLWFFQNNFLGNVCELRTRRHKESNLFVEWTNTLSVLGMPNTGFIFQKIWDDSQRVSFFMQKIVKVDSRFISLRVVLTWLELTFNRLTDRERENILRFFEFFYSHEERAFIDKTIFMFVDMHRQNRTMKRKNVHIWQFYRLMQAKRSYFTWQIFYAFFSSHFISCRHMKRCHQTTASLVLCSIRALNFPTRTSISASSRFALVHHILASSFLHLFFVCFFFSLFNFALPTVWSTRPQNLLII